jgi:hypothetical protein
LYAVLSLVLLCAAIAYRLSTLPHPLLGALALLSISACLFGALAWLVTSPACPYTRVREFCTGLTTGGRSELALEAASIESLLTAPFLAEFVDWPHTLLLRVGAVVLVLIVGGRAVQVITRSSTSAVPRIGDNGASIRKLLWRSFRARTAAIAGLVYAAIVLLVWARFAFTSGMPDETAFSYYSETHPWYIGFIEPSDPLRPFTSVFYHASYLLSFVFGAGGSFAAFQFVYAALWWSRGMLVFLILRRLTGGSVLFPYITGALAIVHASDLALQWVGQLNQFGFIFWMLLGIYLFIRALQAPSVLEAYTCGTTACLCEFLSLWSYESGLFIVFLVPLLIAFWGRRIDLLLLVESAGWYSVGLLYVVLTLIKYLVNKSTYQATVLRSDWETEALLGDLWFNVVHSLNFLSWQTGTPTIPRGELVPPVILAVAAFIVGGIAAVWHSPKTFAPSRRTLAGLLGAGVILLVLSFPAYLLLTSARSLWRTQLLSGLGASVIFASLACFAGHLARSMARRGQWIVPAAGLALTSFVVYAGAARAIDLGGRRQGSWEMHRRAMAGVLHSVPRVQPGTLIFLSNVPKDADPFGHTMWFDMALRLSYPGVSVAGDYALTDGDASGTHFLLKRSKWTAIVPGYAPMFTEVPADHAVILEYGSWRILPEVPARLCLPGCAKEQYRPEARIINEPPSQRAVNRYLPI